MSILLQIFEKNINRNLLFPVERPKNPFYTFLTRCNFFIVVTSFIFLPNGRLNLIKTIGEEILSFF